MRVKELGVGEFLGYFQNSTWVEERFRIDVLDSEGDLKDLSEA